MNTALGSSIRLFSALLRMCSKISVVNSSGNRLQKAYASYTNFTAEPDYENTCYVAELMAEMATADCQEMRKTLLQAPIVIKVLPVAESEYFFKGRQQRVRVEQVFKGEGVAQGEEIIITADRWKAYADNRSIDMGFVNFMKADKWLLQQKPLSHSQFVVAMENHQALTKSSFRSMWRLVERELPNKHLTAHILRHTYITRYSI